MWKGLLLSALALGVLATPAAVAADLNGKWKAEFTTPDGTARFNTFTFKMDGANLTGTVAGAQDQTPLHNRKGSGDANSFTPQPPVGSFPFKGKISRAPVKIKATLADPD